MARTKKVEEKAQENGVKVVERVTPEMVDAAIEAINKAAKGEGAVALNLAISPPNMQEISLRLIGTTPLVQHRFGEKARNQIYETQKAGSQAKKGKKREPKDFEANYQQARHIAATTTDGSEPGWDGIHAGGFRHAMVDACGIVGFHMTKGKKALFVLADGYERDGTPLVKIAKGEPRQVIHPARNASGGADLRSRPMWDAGWECILRVRFDADMFSYTDIVNLVARVGCQCGIAEGRPNSKESTGCDWGLFRLATSQDEA
jgi:hypothetical protein